MKEKQFMCNIEVSVHIYGITGLVKISKTMKYFVDFIGGKKENLTEKSPFRMPDSNQLLTFMLH